jgi:hypothetical protein
MMGPVLCTARAIGSALFINKKHLRLYSYKILASITLKDKLSWPIFFQKMSS